MEVQNSICGVPPYESKYQYSFRFAGQTVGAIIFAYNTYSDPRNQVMKTLCIYIKQLKYFTIFIIIILINFFLWSPGSLQLLTLFTGVNKASSHLCSQPHSCTYRCYTVILHACYVQILWGTCMHCKSHAHEGALKCYQTFPVTLMWGISLVFLREVQADLVFTALKT